MERAVLHFSVRCYSEIPLPEMADQVGEALGCSFHGGRSNDTPAFLAHLLGLRLALYDWRGINNKVVFILASNVAESRFRHPSDGSRWDLKIVDISQPMADLLTVRETGKWHIPSEVEIEAERTHGRRISARIKQEEDVASGWNQGRGGNSAR